MVKDDKYAAIVERLSALDRERLRQQEARRKDTADLVSPLESGAAFQVEFESRRSAAEQLLDEVSSLTAADPKAELDGLALKLAAMEKLVADASYYLPSYDIQASQACIAKLKARMETAVKEITPRRKFSFRNKAVKTGTITTTVPTMGEENRLPAAEEGNEDFSHRLENGDVVKDREGSTIVLDSRGSTSELMLSNLTCCEVYLRGRFRALFFHKLKQCKVYVGPVTGSALLEEAQGCVFMLACHQIRIHSTTDSDFYLRVRSRPIVEHVSNVRFAPYAFGYAGITDDLKASNLEEETDLWNKVDDFRWLRATASPNWMLVPPEERLAPVDATQAQPVGSRDR